VFVHTRSLFFFRCFVLCTVWRMPSFSFPWSRSSGRLGRFRRILCPVFLAAVLWWQRWPQAREQDGGVSFNKAERSSSSSVLSGGAPEEVSSERCRDPWWMATMLRLVLCFFNKAQVRCSQGRVDGGFRPSSSERHGGEKTKGLGGSMWLVLGLLWNRDAEDRRAPFSAPLCWRPTLLTRWWSSSPARSGLSSTSSRRPQVGIVAAHNFHPSPSGSVPGGGAEGRGSISRFKDGGRGCEGLDCVFSILFRVLSVNNRVCPVISYLFWVPSLSCTCTVIF